MCVYVLCVIKIGPGKYCIYLGMNKLSQGRALKICSYQLTVCSGEMVITTRDNLEAVWRNLDAAFKD